MNAIAASLATYIAASALAAPVQGDDNPLVLDRTGLRWVLPFKNALTQAAEQNRLLMRGLLHK